MSNKYNEIWKEHSLEITSSIEQWLSFLDTTSWLFKYSFEDQILIHAQRPNARACATYDTWNDKFHRNFPSD